MLEKFRGNNPNYDTKRFKSAEDKLTKLQKLRRIHKFIRDGGYLYRDERRDELFSSVSEESKSFKAKLKGFQTKLKENFETTQPEVYQSEVEKVEQKLTDIQKRLDKIETSKKDMMLDYKRHAFSSDDRAKRKASEPTRVQGQKDYITQIDELQKTLKELEPFIDEETKKSALDERFSAVYKEVEKILSHERFKSAMEKVEREPEAIKNGYKEAIEDQKIIESREDVEVYAEDVKMYENWRDELKKDFLNGRLWAAREDVGSMKGDASFEKAVQNYGSDMETIDVLYTEIMKEDFPYIEKNFADKIKEVGDEYDFIDGIEEIRDGLKEAYLNERLSAVRKDIEEIMKENTHFENAVEKVGYDLKGIREVYIEKIINKDFAYIKEEFADEIKEMRSEYKFIEKIEKMRNKMKEAYLNERLSAVRKDIEIMKSDTNFKSAVEKAGYGWGKFNEKYVERFINKDIADIRENFEKEIKSVENEYKFVEAIERVRDELEVRLLWVGIEDIVKDNFDAIMKTAREDLENARKTHNTHKENIDLYRNNEDLNDHEKYIKEHGKYIEELGEYRDSLQIKKEFYKIYNEVKPVEDCFTNIKTMLRKIIEKEFKKTYYEEIAKRAKEEIDKEVEGMIDERARNERTELIGVSKDEWNGKMKPIPGIIERFRATTNNQERRKILEEFSASSKEILKNKEKFEEGEILLNQRGEQIKEFTKKWNAASKVIDVINEDLARIWENFEDKKKEDKKKEDKENINLHESMDKEYKRFSDIIIKETGENSEKMQSIDKDFGELNDISKIKDFEGRKQLIGEFDSLCGENLSIGKVVDDAENTLYRFCKESNGATDSREYIKRTLVDIRNEWSSKDTSKFEANIKEEYNELFKPENIQTIKEVREKIEQINISMYSSKIDEVEKREGLITAISVLHEKMKDIESRVLKVQNYLRKDIVERYRNTYCEIKDILKGYIIEEEEPLKEEKKSQELSEKEKKEPDLPKRRDFAKLTLYNKNENYLMSSKKVEQLIEVLNVIAQAWEKQDKNLLLDDQDVYLDTLNAKKITDALKKLTFHQAFEQEELAKSNLLSDPITQNEPGKDNKEVQDVHMAKTDFQKLQEDISKLYEKIKEPGGKIKSFSLEFPGILKEKVRGSEQKERMSLEKARANIEELKSAITTIRECISLEDTSLLNDMKAFFDHPCRDQYNEIVEKTKQLSENAKKLPSQVGNLATESIRTSIKATMDGTDKAGWLIFTDAKERRRANSIKNLSENKTLAMQVYQELISKVEEQSRSPKEWRKLLNERKQKANQLIGILQKGDVQCEGIQAYQNYQSKLNEFQVIVEESVKFIESSINPIKDSDHSTSQKAEMAVFQGWQSYLPKLEEKRNTLDKEFKEVFDSEKNAFTQQQDTSAQINFETTLNKLAERNEDIEKNIENEMKKFSKHLVEGDNWSVANNVGETEEEKQFLEILYRDTVDRAGAYKELCEEVNKKLKKIREDNRNFSQNQQKDLNTHYKEYAAKIIKMNGKGNFDVNSSFDANKAMRDIIKILN